MWDIFAELFAFAMLAAVVLSALCGVVWLISRIFRRQTIHESLKRLFRPAQLMELAVSERQFPLAIRADLQQAVDAFCKESKLVLFRGISPMHYGMGGVNFASLLDSNPMNAMQSSLVGPPQFEQIDVGEDQPLSVLQSGLWLLRRDGARFAILYGRNTEYGSCGISMSVRVQVAHPNDDRHRTIADEFFQRLERAVLEAKCYRGKILSFESSDSYSGQAAGVRVHRLSSVQRDDVILPTATVDLLDRNVLEFVKQRPALAAMNLSVKKGLLFYGPPGTGKTHTIRYLAGALAGHTTFLISAEQVGQLGEYLTLARLLQPSLVVLEDVDLIARSREEMHNPQSELLLNKLLNEMDGLREDAQILFVLTTNRPEDLESALASRPGRIDQAVEFPLPNSAGREKLVRLYARGMPVDSAVTAEIVRRTDRVSASFIKELMRRVAQRRLMRNGQNGEITLDDVEQALEEMLFSGGSLNLKLLGAAERGKIGFKDEAD